MNIKSKVKSIRIPWLLIAILSMFIFVSLIMVKGGVAVTDTARITIDSLGITMDVPVKLADITYKIDSTTYPDSPSILFSTKSLEAMDNNGQCSSSHAPIGVITLTRHEPVKLESAPSVDNWHLIGHYYAIYQSPQQPCNNSKEAASLQMSQAILLHSSLINIKEKTE